MSGDLTVHSKEPVRERVLKGAGEAFGMAVAYILLGLLLWVVRGRSLRQLPADTFSVMLSVYVVGALVAGALIGLVQPLLTTLPRILVAHTLAAVPFAMGINALFFQSPELAHRDPTGRVLLIALFLGTIFGTAYWKQDWERRYPGIG